MSPANHSISPPCTHAQELDTLFVTCMQHRRLSDDPTAWLRPAAGSAMSSGGALIEGSSYGMSVDRSDEDGTFAEAPRAAVVWDPEHIKAAVARGQRLILLPDSMYCLIPEVRMGGATCASCWDYK